MGVKIEAEALTTLERAKRHIGIPPENTSEDPAIIDLVNAASGWARGRCLQPIRQQAIAFTNAGDGFIRGDGTARLVLPHKPCLALTSLTVDARLSTTADWSWDSGTNAESGALRYGATHDWVLDQRLGIVTMLNGMLFPCEPVVAVDGVFGLADGSTANPLPLNAAFPHSTSIFGSSQSGGRYHASFGWDGIQGLAIREKVAQLVAWMYRAKDRAQDGIASRSGEGLTVTYLEDAPKEIRDFFDRLKGSPV